MHQSRRSLPELVELGRKQLEALKQESHAAPISGEVTMLHASPDCAHHSTPLSSSETSNG
jgi:hypothetical protein